MRLDYLSQSAAYELESERVCAPFISRQEDECSLQYCLLQQGLIENSIQMPLSKIKRFQRSAVVTHRLLRAVKHQTPVREWHATLKPFKLYASQLQLQDQLLVLSREGKEPANVLSSSKIAEIASRAHQEHSHPGRNKLLMMMQERFWNPSMSKIVEDVCLSCLDCQRFKTRSQPVTAPIHKLAMTRPFQLVAADCVSLPRTQRGNIGCVVFVDHMTKWAYAVPIKNKRAETIASVFEDQVLPSLPRKPERILSDNGGEFAGAVFNNMLRKYGIGHTFSTPEMPSCNGAVERLNRTLIQMLRCNLGDGGEWDDRLTQVLLDYNHLPHSALNMSPSDFLLKNPHSLEWSRNDEEGDEH
ncbi:MAG: DDE-type integrase/transposase/recombinase, partial [Bacteroidota bacterium]